MRPLRCLLLILLQFCLPFAHAEPSAALPEDILVAVQVRDGEVIVDVDLRVEATPHEVWAVLTDYDHMTSFISNLESSRVVSANGDTLTISQKGKAAYGPLSFSFDNVRELKLSPYSRIDSRLIKGSMKKLEGTTRLAAADSGTRITYHGESIPNVWIPPGIGKTFIERETREQFAEMRQEILKRKLAAGGK
ncbi:MAG: SRPBCC family protein [Rhodocyclaceae bacterium]|nr:SRPBCC family protein [Rhodocyclaceae bacterium]